VVGLLVLPTSTAVAFFSTTTGSGSVDVQIGTSTTSTVSINGSNLSYSQGSTLSPGGTVNFRLNLVCLTNCPAQVSTVSLSPTWSSNTSGCNSGAQPGQFTMPQATINASVTNGGGQFGTLTVSMVDLGSGVDQRPCSNAMVTLTLTTP
jgi:hypothetical protein